MKAPRINSESGAYTRADLVVTVGVVSCLAAMAWPAVGVSAGRSARVLCMNNLRQIGQAFQIWSHDHALENPWRVTQDQGGTLGNPLVSAAWYQYSWVSNQLSTPRVLVCPEDPSKRPASDWSLSPNGGLLNSRFRDNSVSYSLGIHTGSLIPHSLLGSDRNIRFSAKGSCSIGVNNVWQLTKGEPTVGWTNAVHGLSGNLLLNDGQVLEASTARLQEQLNVPSPVGNENLHLLCP